MKKFGLLNSPVLQHRQKLLSWVVFFVGFIGLARPDEKPSSSQNPKTTVHSEDLVVVMDFVVPRKPENKAQSGHKTIDEDNNGGIGSLR
ncbi:unnamed protein product [Ilex paraguariensis]|uniref:Uncharacterized protein n=1 Tax=Ilex paraguariensis TaxID=185542 RepID=A0ABC8THC5_9AQUA